MQGQRASGSRLPHTATRGRQVKAMHPGAGLHQNPSSSTLNVLCEELELLELQMIMRRSVGIERISIKSLKLAEFEREI